ncbi:MAG: glyoxylate/hydroxypyruvate reductase A [Rhodospirillales bacterium]|nr:MAG: glyoxylate/hydroxypyruvate reductase A [Rhodospirillales bacterium]
MQRLLPEFDCRLWEDPGDPEDVEYAVVWRPPPGGLKRFPNLKCIVSIGAGVDHIYADPELPPDIPIIRTVGTDLRQRMREYVMLHVLRFHRRLPEFEAQQATASWDQHITPPAPDRRVGVMGLGNMGRACAEALAYLGFDTAGWSRSQKRLAGITGFHGPDALDGFLSQSEILVNLLPLTPRTDGILNAALFEKLPEGACIVNAGRGEHLIEEDLIPALDCGRLGGATLDVFREEPLPPDHPFWAHPKILVTPHVASLIDPLAGGRLIAENLRRFIRGDPVPDMVDLKKGY